MPANSTQSPWLPQQTVDSLGRTGWDYASSNEVYDFFERPGYWLRIQRPSRAGGKIFATIVPETYRVPRPGSYFVPFADDEMAPAFTGRGAHTKALEAARKIWNAHETVLATLGIELREVGSRRSRPSGGKGSQVDTVRYSRRDLFEHP